DMFEGRSPDGSAKLVQNAGRHVGKRKRVPGWDMTFSAPKSVSVLWSQAPPEIQAKIEAIHARSVKSALAKAEELAGYTRRGEGGTRRERCDLIFAVFEHGSSREQEPELHSHAVLLNLGVRKDGSTGAIQTGSLYDFKMALGALYRCEMAAGLESD